MSPTIISITNQKGGVGKTTTACALLSSLHNRGAKVLGVDLDPQGSLSFSSVLILSTASRSTMYSAGPLPLNRPSPLQIPAIFFQPIFFSPQPNWNFRSRGGNFC